MVDDGVPLLGICVGLQWLFEGSEEAPDVEGLVAVQGNLLQLAGPSPKSQGLKPLESATCWLEFTRDRRGRHG